MKAYIPPGGRPAIELRRFVPIEVDRYQAAAYRLEFYTFDGLALRAHFGDGTSRPSVYATVADLLAAGKADWRERVREVAPPIQLPTVTVPPELLPLALDIQEARVKAEAEGSLRMRMTNVRTDERSMEERRVR